MTGGAVEQRYFPSKGCRNRWLFTYEAVFIWDLVGKNSLFGSLTCQFFLKLISSQRKWYIVKFWEDISRKNEKITITLALFGVSGPASKFCWLWKNHEFPIWRLFHIWNVINFYLGRKNNDKKCEERKVFVSGFFETNIIYCRFSNYQYSDAKIKIHRFSVQYSTQASGREVLLEILMEDFKPVVVKKLELENPDVVIANNFCTFGLSRSRSKKNKHTKGS